MVATAKSRILVPIPNQSYDSRYWSRYPLGDRPFYPVADAKANATAIAFLQTQIKLAATPAARASATAQLQNFIRLVANANAQSSATANLSAGGAGLTAQAEWNSHKVAAGVVAAYGLDNSSDYAWIHPGANGIRAFGDATSQKLFTGGCLRFDLRAGESGADISGNWCKDVDPYTFGTSFGQNTTFWIRFFLKLSSTMYGNFGSGWSASQATDWKIATIFRGGDPTCANMDITVKGTGGTGVPDHVYTDCGNRGCRTRTDSPLEEQTPSNPHLFQQGWSDPTQTSGTYTKEALAWPDRAYPSWPDALPTDEWFAIMLKIHIGTYGSQNSTIEEWTKQAGDAGWRKKISCRTLINNNNSSSNGFTNIQLTPFMTGLNHSATQNAFMYFQGLLVGTQQLPEPTVFS